MIMSSLVTLYIKITNDDQVSKEKHVGYMHKCLLYESLLGNE